MEQATERPDKTDHDANAGIEGEPGWALEEFAGGWNLVERLKGMRVREVARVEGGWLRFRLAEGAPARAVAALLRRAGVP